MMDKDFTIPIEIVIKAEKENLSAIDNRKETFSLLDKLGGLKGDVLDIAERNYLTELLEQRYNIGIDSTTGDLDIEFICPQKKYDFVYYSHVIEHQFNPLFTLLKIKKILKKNGILILACPVKPHWITWDKGHFHEFDLYRIHKLIERASYKIIEEKQFHYHKGFRGIRPILGSFYPRLYLAILK